MTDSRVQESSELFSLPKDVKRASIIDSAEAAKLFHHEFLHRELVDDTFDSSRVSSHLQYLEMDVEFVFILQSLDTANSLDVKIIVRRLDDDIIEDEITVCTAELRTQPKGLLESYEDRCKRF